MKRNYWAIAASMACALLGLTPEARAQPMPGGGRWEQLGCVEVGRRADFDAIQVGRREGRFRAIMLTVSGNDVHIEDLRVIYANGQPDRIAVRAEMREGSRSQPLDLQGRGRAIHRIEVVSQRGYRGQGRGRARLCVAGLADDTPGRPHVGRWEQLGCQQVGMAVDRDVIRVGRRDGRFRAIRLDVRGNDIYLEDLTVMYGNGERDQVPVRALIRQGTQTAPLDLRGNERAIERIEMIYRAVPNHRGVARVCASGLG